MQVNAIYAVECAQFQWRCAYYNQTQLIDQTDLFPAYSRQAGGRARRVARERSARFSRGGDGDLADRPWLPGLRTVPGVGLGGRLHAAITGEEGMQHAG